MRRGRRPTGPDEERGRIASLTVVRRPVVTVFHIMVGCIDPRT
jgi:hypothetical protein